LKKVFSKFLSDESGATAIEYGLIAAGISLAIIAVVNGLGSNLNDKYTSINTSWKSEVTALSRALLGFAVRPKDARKKGRLNEQAAQV
jgi:pilus assembly protein Flp/PilA